MPRVLLVSPLPRLDPPNGDVTYTLGLLDHPPEGVTYVTYADAIASGELRERARRADGLSLARLREGAVNRLRRRELLFREPFRFFDVTPRAFDLIHCHVFNAKFESGIPVVVSSSAAPEWLYRDGEAWSAARVAWARTADRFLRAVTGVEHIGYHLSGVQRVVAWTRYLRDWYVEHGVADRNRIDVVPPSVDIPPEVLRERSPSRLLFVGNYDIKGGDVALGAFEIVHRARPETTLTIVGSRPRSAHPAVTWLDRLPRERLLDEMMPAADILVYPTRFDGLALVLLEALSRGLPIAASNYRMVPEAIGAGGLTSAVDDVETLASNILRLMEPEVHRRTAVAAREQAVTHYSRRVTRELLLSTYRTALSGS